jgi:hypothetical protein
VRRTHHTGGSLIQLNMHSFRQCENEKEAFNHAAFSQGANTDCCFGRKHINIITDVVGQGAQKFHHPHLPVLLGWGIIFVAL